MARIEYLMNNHGMNGTVSRLGPVQRAVMAKAEQGGAIAAGHRAAHYARGDADIQVRHHLPGQYGDIDSDISLVDKNAKAIEYGRGPGSKSGRGVGATRIMGKTLGDLIAS